MTLSYCLNVHPGETLEELLAVLAGPVARVKQAWSPDEPMGVGLWLPLAAARELAGDEGEAERFRAALAAGGLFAYTVNAFPQGGFHEAGLKQGVYRPAWNEPARLDYTQLAFRALTRLLEPGQRGSVSTVPVSYKGFGPDAATLDEAARNLARAALEAERLDDETGRSLQLALEPEPLATLETTPEAIAFLQARVFGGPGRAWVEGTGLSAAQSEDLLRRRVGVCVDTCHLACQFESVTESVRTLTEAGVAIPKAQLSSALELRRPSENAAGRRRLKAFDEPRYLHQSVGLRGQERVYAEDLSDLLGPEAELCEPFARVDRIRTHFHVPLCWEGDQELGTTRDDLVAGLGALARATDHLEVETYTFAALPAEDRARYDDDVVQMLTAELHWARAAIASALG